MQTFGINGFGRIGRTAFRVWWLKHRQELDLKVINTSGSMDLSSWAHLLRYDSNYGPFADIITVQEHQKHDQVTESDPVLGTLTVTSSTNSTETRTVTVTAQRDPLKIPWQTSGVHTVVESTGVFITAEKASAHLKAGAQRVIVSAPPKGGDVPIIVLGVSRDTPSSQIVSNASCTTNCITPVIAVLHTVFGVQKALLNTIHSYTDDQNLHDNSQRDLRRARAAAKNIVPTTTGAAIATTAVIPELKDLFDGLSVRVPTSVGSLSDIVSVLKRKTTIAEVNAAFEQASQDPRWKGILAVTNEPIVSSDIIGRSESAIVDLSLTKVIDGDLVRVIAWYDNEWGYCNRLVEQIAVLS